MSIVQCQFCKKEIEKETAYHNGRWHYCNSTCYKNKQDKLKYKPKKEINNEPNPRRKLTDYIMKLYVDHGCDKHKIPWQLLMSQLKNIMDEHKEYNYDSIRYTLWYMSYIQEINLFSEQSNGSVLALVPFYYLSAKEYCEKTIQINKFVAKKEQQGEIIVKAKPHTQRNKYKELSFD